MLPLIIRNLARLALFLSVMGTAPASIRKVEGRVIFEPLHREAVEFNFTAELVPEEGVTTVRLWHPESPDKVAFQIQWQPGEMLLESVQVETLGKQAGPLLFVFATRGAGSVGVTVIGLKADGMPGVIFESSCRGGYQILDSEGDGARQLIEIVEGYGYKTYTANIYASGAKGELKLLKTEKVRRPHAYFLRRD